MDPECNSKLNKALTKQTGVCCGICSIPLLLFFIIVQVILGEAAFSSPYFNCSRVYSTGKVTCEPKDENGLIIPHENTLIFFHPLTGRSSQYLSWFIKEKGEDTARPLAPLNTRIVFPQAPKQTNKWFGADPVSSWFNELESKEGPYNVTYLPNTWKVNQTDLEGRKKEITDV